MPPSCSTREHLGPSALPRTCESDSWENANGLNPADPADRYLVADDSYTMLERYLNRLS